MAGETNNPNFNQFDIPAYSSSNPFIQPIMSMMGQSIYSGTPIAQGMGGRGPLDISPITGLIGLTDPGTKTILNSVVGSVLTSSLGGGYLPSQYSPTTNMYSQMQAMQATKGYSSAMQGAAQADRRGMFETARGMAQLTGSEFGPREQEAAHKFADVASTMLPYLPAAALESMGVGGKTGLATAMAQNMFMGSRYATDPITGKRGIEPSKVGEMSSKVFENLYGEGKDVSQMGGITAGKAGEMYDVMNRKGLMGSAATRSKALEQVAKDMNVTIGEASSLPELDTKIRELDANRISEKLKEMSKSVSAMKEIFGEMGQPDAPMGQLVGAIEALTQANLPSMDSAKTERMIRDTSNTAKAAGIDMPQMFRLMGSTAAMSDRAGVDRVFTPEITKQAVLENEASKRMFGDSKAFGLSTAEKRLNMSQQLGVQATKDPRVQQMAAVARLVDQYKFKPKEGSELANVYDVITGKKEATEEETRKILNITSRPGGLAGFLKDQGVSASVTRDLVANQSSNAEFMHKYDIGTKMGKSMQTEKVTRELSMYGEHVISRYAKDSTTEGSADLKKEMLGGAKELSQVVSRALMNPGSDEVGDPQGIAKRAIEAHLKSKGIKTSGAGDDALIDSMSAGLAESAGGYAVRGNMGSYANMATTMSPKILREAAITRAEVGQQSKFQEILRGVGKTDVGQRVADLLRDAGPNTSMKDGVAAILGFTRKEDVVGLLGPEIEAMEKAAKQFHGFDANKVKESYLKNAAVQNKIELDAASAPEDKERLQRQKEEIKSQMKSAGFGGSTPGELEKAYSGFADFTKLEEFKGKDTAAALVAAKDNLANFEKNNGVTIEDVKTLDKRKLKTIGEERALEDLKKATQGAGMDFINKQGRITPGSTPFSGLNSAYNNLNDTDTRNAKYGLDAFESFSNTYMRSPDAASMGEKGLAAIDKGVGANTMLKELSSGLKVSMDDLIAGKVPEGMDTSYLKKIRGEDSGLVESLKDTTTSDIARKSTTEEIDRLKKEAETTPALRDRNNLRIKEKEKILNASPEELDEIKAAADKTVADLSGADNELISKKKEESDLAAKLQDPKQSDAVRESTKEEVAKLRAATPTDPKLKDKNNLRIEELEKILNAKPEDLKEIKASADKTVADLTDPARQANAITSEFKKFEGAQKSKEEADTALTRLIKDIGGKQGLDLTKDNLPKFLKEGMGEANLKKAVGFGNDSAVLSATDKSKKEALLKEAGASNVAQMKKINQIQSLDSQKKTELTNLANKKDKSPEDNKKLAVLLKESGASTVEEYNELSKKPGLSADKTKELLGFDRAGLTKEEIIERDKITKEGGYKDLTELQAGEQFGKKLRDKLTPEQRDQLKKGIDLSEKAMGGVDATIKTLAKYSPEALTSVVKKSGLASLVSAGLKQGKEAVAAFGGAIGNPTGKPLTKEQVAERNENRDLKANGDKFLRSLNVGDDAVKDTTGKGRGEVASQINKASRDALALDDSIQNKSKATLEDRTKSLRNLLHAEDGTLTEKQRELKKTLTTTGGMSKEMFQKGDGTGKDAAQFSTEEMKKKFMEADKKIKVAQEKSAEKGPLLVSLGKEVVKIEGNLGGIVRLEGKSDIVAKGPAPVSAAST